MKALQLILMSLLAMSCAPALQNNLNSEKGKKEYCEYIGENAGAGAAVKLSAMQSNIPQEDLWKYVAIAVGEELEEIGYSDMQIEEFSKQIVDNSIMPIPDHEIVSFHYYFSFSCRLKLDGKEYMELEEASKVLEKCWRSDQTLETSVCFEKAISKEIQL